MKTIVLLLIALVLPAQLAGAQQGVARGKQKWALIIGIAGYEARDLKLKYANQDALEFADFIRTPRGGGFSPSNTHVVVNKEADRRRLYAEFDWLYKNVGPEDVVYVYFAGHGSEYRGIDYLLPSDASPTEPDAMGIEMTKFLNKVTSDLQAQQVVVFLDACYAAAATEGRSRGNEGLDPADDWQKTNEKKGQVRMAFFSSQANQTSWEDDEYQHGLFTYYLMEALEGAARAGSDGRLDADSVLKYVRDNVEKRSREKFPHVQTPGGSPRFQGDYILAIKSTDPFRDTLLEWIEAAGHGFWGYGVGRPDLWTPNGRLPDADYCSGSDGDGVPGVSCAFAPVNTLERGVSDFDDVIVKTRRSLGSGWHEDDSRRLTFDSRKTRTVVFATTSATARVMIRLTKSGEWYQVDFTVKSAPPRDESQFDPKPRLDAVPIEISAGKGATLTWDTGGGEAFIVGYGKKVSGKGSAVVNPSVSTEYIMVSGAGSQLRYTPLQLLVTGSKGGDEFPSLEEFNDALRGSRFGVDYINFQSSVWSALQERGYLIKGDYVPKRAYITFYTNFILRPDLVLGEKIRARRLAVAVEISEPDERATISLGVRTRLEFQNRGEDTWFPDKEHGLLAQAEAKKILQALETLK